MQLLDLPGELLDEVINHTVPSGIEAFVLACKTVHSRARAQLQAHYALKRRWRITRLRPWVEPEFIWHLFYRLAQNPLAADYIEELDLWDVDELSDATGEWPSHLLSQDELNAVIAPMVLGSDILKRSHIQPEAWWDAMMGSHECGDRDLSFAIVFLLSLLRNLKTLRLAPLWAAGHHTYETDDMWAPVLDDIVTHANAGREGENALSRLETLMPCSESGDEETAGMDTLEYFMPLKSLREWYGVSVTSMKEEWGQPCFHWRLGNLTSPLRRIELVYCSMDADGIGQLLSHTPGLEVFKYSHETKVAINENWNAGAFIEAVAHHCGRTIKHLALAIDDVDEDIVNGASSFLSFPNLLTLEIDTKFFRGPGIESGQRHGLDPYVPAGDTPWTQEDIPCIGSMLPTSITEIQLNVDSPDLASTAAKALLKNIPEERATRLTRLRSFLIRQCDDDSIRPLAEEAGVDFELFRRDERHPVRSMMQKWKRDFVIKAGRFQCLD